MNFSIKKVIFFMISLAKHCLVKSLKTNDTLFVFAVKIVIFHKKVKMNRRENIGIFFPLTSYYLNKLIQNGSCLIANQKCRDPFFFARFKTNFLQKTITKIQNDENGFGNSWNNRNNQLVDFFCSLGIVIFKFKVPDIQLKR